MNLAELIQFLEQDIQPLQAGVFKQFAGKSVRNITDDSREVQKGSVFVCLEGEKSDGHQYIGPAIRAGAVAIVVQDLSKCPKGLWDTYPVLKSANTYKALGVLSSRFYDKPGEKILTIGVTGTNGKTTVTHLIDQILCQSGKKSGLLGTLGFKGQGDKAYDDMHHTTPMSVELQALMARLVGEEYEALVMEVSSHALDQHRVYGCDFDIAVHTNLTQDHLDYHKTMENYFKAKSLLFSGLEPRSGKPKQAVINLDDEWAQRFIQVCPTNVDVLTYSLINPEASIYAENLNYAIDGASFTCVTPKGRIDIRLKIAGQFGVYNALAAIGVGVAMGIDLAQIKSALEAVEGIRGRFEVVSQRPAVIVDYAHTPDGLKNILSSTRPLVPAGGRLIAVFGCGGDRDATKRPKMGRIAEELADMLVVTSDNPRTEDPQQIITDILAGIERFDSQRMVVDPDRQAAIHRAIDMARPEDIIVIAGKGHEDYQILADRTIHFDDREVVQQYVRLKTSGASTFAP